METTKKLSDEELITKIIFLTNSYWRFDDSQAPLSSWHEKQDFLDEINKLILNNSTPPVKVVGESVEMLNNILLVIKLINELENSSSKNIIMYRSPEKSYTTKELAIEIKNQTETGRKFIISFLNGLEKMKGL